MSEGARVVLRLMYIFTASNKEAEQLSRDRDPFKEMLRRWPDARCGAAPDQVDELVVRVCASHGSYKEDDNRWRGAKEEVMVQYIRYGDTGKSGSAPQICGKYRH